MVQPVLLTAEQVAERLGVSRSLIYGALRSGALPGYRIGCRGRGTWRVEAYQVEAWLQTLKASERPPDDDRPFKYL